MGQIEVYELLKNLRTCKDERFFCVREVENLLKEKGFSNGVLKNTRRSLMRLSLSGYLEVKMSGKVTDWKRLYRIKEEYVNIEVTS